MNTSTTTTPGTSTTSGGQSDGFVIGGLNLDPTALMAESGGSGFDLTAADMGQPEQQTQTQTQQQPAVMHVPATDDGTTTTDDSHQQQQTHPATTTTEGVQSTTTQAVSATLATPLTSEQVLQTALSLIPQTVQQTLAAQQAHAQSQAAAQPQYTTEQLDQMFSVVRLKPDDVAKLGLSPEALPVLEALLHSAAKMGAAVAKHHTASELQTVHQTFQPVLSHVQQQQAVQLKNDFFSQHADLKEYEPLVMAVQAQLKQTGFRGTKEQAFEAVASGARGLLAKVQGSGQAQQTGQQATTATANGQTNQPASQSNGNSQATHRMSTLSGGGQGGTASGSGQGAAKKDLTWSVWD
jgi:hypothetical protein